MSGPPGAGKTLIAKSLPGILTRISEDEALEVTKIYSVAGLLPPDTQLIMTRPYRSPHYTICCSGLADDEDIQPAHLAESMQ